MYTLLYWNWFTQMSLSKTAAGHTLGGPANAESIAYPIQVTRWSFSVKILEYKEYKESYFSTDVEGFAEIYHY